ncbi:MAG: hypothetical protein M9913_12815 [Bryobacteraceae bacterium]|nr:hypothetical protein [Solibacteraceae bacterium]MCO5351755.1 hypothetical protein [Bryobacteraceae bacterium]
MLKNWKYWGYFAVKAMAAAGLVWALLQGLNVWMPEPGIVAGQYRLNRFAQHLPWTAAFLGVWLVAAGLIYLAIWDQKQRCRVCLRRLRMPVGSGSWDRAALFSPPETQRICPYGHGTLATPEAHVAAAQRETWTVHEDIWKELKELEGREP